MRDASRAHAARRARRGLPARGTGGLAQPDRERLPAVRAPRSRRRAHGARRSSADIHASAARSTAGWRLSEVSAPAWRAQPADEEPLLSLLSFAVVDVETTGGRPEGGDRITEIAAVVVRDGRIGEVYETLVNPERSIPPFITRLTNISWEMVRDKRAVPRRVRRRAQGARGTRVRRAQRGVRLALRDRGGARGPGARARRAATLHGAARAQAPAAAPLDARSTGWRGTTDVEIEPGKRHRAAGDAVATAHCLLRLLDDARGHGCERWSELERFLAAADRRAQTAWPPGAGDAATRRPGHDGVTRSALDSRHAARFPSSRSAPSARSRVHAIQAGGQQLDGGAMFGVVPKPLWERRIPADERNRIPLGMRCLLIEHDRRARARRHGGRQQGEREVPRRFMASRTPGAESGRTQLEDGLGRGGVRAEDVATGDQHAPALRSRRRQHVARRGRRAGARVPERALRRAARRMGLGARTRTSARRPATSPHNFDPVARRGPARVRRRRARDAARDLACVRTPGHTPHHQSVLVERDGERLFYPRRIWPRRRRTCRCRGSWATTWSRCVTLESKRRDARAEAAAEGWLVMFEHDAVRDRVRPRSSPTETGIRVAKCVDPRMPELDFAALTRSNLRSDNSAKWSSHDAPTLWPSRGCEACCRSPQSASPLPSPLTASGRRSADFLPRQVRFLCSLSSRSYELFRTPPSACASIGRSASARSA